MHQQVMEFLRRMKTGNPVAFAPGCRVLECGSYNINGSARELFEAPSEYLGLDWRSGPGVDRVGLAHEYEDPAGFDTVISTEMLEHDPHWRASLANMVSLTRPGGSLIVTCAGAGRPAHELACAPDPAYYRGLSVVEVVQELRRAGVWEHIHAEQHDAPADTYVMCGGLLSERPSTALADARSAQDADGGALPVPAIAESVSVIVPAVGNVALTAKCIAAARDNAGMPCEIILVDNGSSPPHAEALAGLGADVYLRYDRMLGYPAACNRGIEVAGCEYVCLLNNDAEPQTPGWAHQLMQSFRCWPGAAIVSPVTDFVANPVQLLGRAAIRPQAVERLFFVCVMMRRQLFVRVGLLDEAFGLGNSEDEEFCWRVRQAGGELVVDPLVFVHHAGHATFGRLPQGMFETLLARNRALLDRKTGER